MDEKEKEEEELFSKENLAQWQKNAAENSKGRFYPINEYEHAAYLVDSEQDELKNPSQLVDRAIQLSNIGDDYVLRLQQTSAQLLVNFFDMARREPGLKLFFDIRYHEWRSEILLTKTKSGSEREKQAAVGTRYVPAPRAVSGYAPDLQSGQNDGGDLDELKKMMPFKKRR